jgi:hypothetical protein
MTRFTCPIRVPAEGTTAETGSYSLNGGTSRVALLMFTRAECHLGDSHGGLLFPKYAEGRMANVGASIVSHHDGMMTSLKSCKQL